jgi:hypothetical protein
MIFVTHIKSILKGKWTLARLRIAFILLRKRQSRGGGYMGEIMALMSYASIFMTPLLYLNTFLDAKWGFTLPLWFSFAAMAGYFIFTYCLGWYDEDKLKIWQTEQELASRRYNPFILKMDAKLNKILKMVKELEKDKKWQVMK